MPAPDYHPNLPTDRSYLEKVAKSVKPKEKLEDIRFEYLNEFLQAMGFDEDPYSMIRVDQMDSAALEHLVEDVFSDLKQTILNANVSQKLYQLWDYLGEEDTMESADLIFVFGGAGVARAHQATRLFKLGLAPKILFTGKHASFMKGIELSEAETAAEFAMEQGVSEEGIILEMESENTPENVINGLRILKAIDFLPKKIILVTNQHHMRRSYYSFKAALDFPVKLIRQPCVPEKFNRETFFKDKDGFTYVVYEYLKMYGARLMKHF